MSARLRLSDFPVIAMPTTEQMIALAEPGHSLVVLSVGGIAATVTLVPTALVDRFVQEFAFPLSAFYTESQGAPVVVEVLDIGHDPASTPEAPSRRRSESASLLN